ncbi:vesicular glutamate transporter 3-like isoform X2 [Planococcus citri]|uniref:vesicular glutamate transporter 3-like isoform X2 n=1 Tax=Planococcus citri TaxID=170843 RepID=UPI0031F8EDE4
MKSRENSPNDIPKEVPEILSSETAVPSIWLSKRILVTFLIFLGLINLSFIKGNISIAMVDMTSRKLLVQGNQTIIQPAEFDWESTTKALILNVYAYGGLCSFLLSSLPAKLGGSRTYGTIMMLLSVLTMFTPVGLHLDFRCLLALRFIIGFFENIAFSSTSDVFRHWIPLIERSRLMSFSHNGTYIGAALLYSVCGFLAHKWGWSMVFYSTGLCTFIWSLIWLILVPNDPSTDRWISKSELSYILAEIETTAPSTGKISTPYKSILTSVPFWALAMSRICLGWSVAVIYQCLPLFVKDATQKTTDLVGFLSSIPSIVCAVLIPILGTVMNYWKNKSNIKYTKMHKIIIGFNFFVGGCLVAAAASMSNFIVSITCFAINGDGPHGTKSFGRSDSFNHFLVLVG